MRFSFVFSLIFKNQNYFQNTSILTKNVFLVTLKAKYQNHPNYANRKTLRINWKLIFNIHLTHIIKYNSKWTPRSKVICSKWQVINISVRKNIIWKILLCGWILSSLIQELVKELVRMEYVCWHHNGN